ncbi:MAG: uroporphyrinogen-III C-methyltransferase [Pseudomonadota bacterium]
MNQEPKKTASHTISSAHIKKWGLIFCFAAFVLCIAGLLWMGGRDLITANSLQSQNAQMTSQIQNMTTMLQKQQDSITANQNDIQQLQNLSNQNSWRLAEVNYLIQSANITLQYKKDIPTAIQLLQAANHQLTHALMTDDVVALQKMLKAKINELQNAPKIDTVTLYIRIQKLIDNADTLTLSKLKFPKKPLTEKTLKNIPAWKAALIKSWDKIRSVLIIQRHKAKVVLPFDDQQKLLFVMNIKMLLTQAQWAALQQESTIFETSISQAILLLDRYAFQLNNTQQMIKELRALKKISLNRDVPTMTDLLMTLQKTTTANT